MHLSIKAALCLDALVRDVISPPPDRHRMLVRANNLLTLVTLRYLTLIGTNTKRLRAGCGTLQPWPLSSTVDVHGKQCYALLVNPKRVVDHVNGRKDMIRNQISCIQTSAKVSLAT